MGQPTLQDLIERIASLRQRQAKLADEHHELLRQMNELLAQKESLHDGLAAAQARVQNAASFLQKPSP